MVQPAARQMAKRLAIVAGEFLLIIALLPSSDGREQMRNAAAAVGIAIAIAAVSRWSWLVRHAASRARRLMPIWFERRMTGRFKLRPRRAGREVEIWAGYQLAAAVNVRVDRDEIVIYPWVEIAEAELDEMGAALGQAILIAARAESQITDRRTIASG